MTSAGRNAVLFLRWQRCVFAAGIWLCALLSACGSAATEVPLSDASPTLRPAVATANVGNATEPVATAPATTTPDPSTVLVWWPSALYPGDQSVAAALLHQQVNSYQSSQARTVRLRIKRADGVGGIYQTLRSGSVVAPSAMPDLTLLRRGDLVQAASAKLIEPIAPRIFSADDVFTPAMMLGQVRGVQYGIPYALEVQHAVYRSSVIPTPLHTLDDVLRIGQPFLFPASASKGVNVTFLAQYLAAGGRIATDKGAATLDRAPLVTVLHFYEQALEMKIVGPQLLDYSSAAQYWPLFAAGKASLIQIDSTSYLAMRASTPAISATMTPIASPGDSTLSVLDGWMWVVTTADPDKQARALGVLAWLMQADQQGLLLHELGVLPSRRSALQRWADDPYAQFAQSLLELPAVPPLDMVDASVATALQKGFEDVLLGRKSAEVAADDAIAQVTGTP